MERDKLGRFQGLHHRSRKMGCKNILIFVLFTLLILFTLPSVWSIGLSGPPLSPIIYEPGKVVSAHFTIGDTSKEIRVSVSGSLSEYITLSEVVDNQFDMTIKFPDQLIASGTYYFLISAEEVADGKNAAIGSLLSVTKRLRIEVYSNEKDIAIDLYAPSVNQNSTLPFKIIVESRCYREIDSVQGEITIYDNNNKLVGTIKTDPTSLSALSRINLDAPFDTMGLVASDYHAQAIVTYDGEQKIVNATFKIGNLDLLLMNYTKELEQGFSEFKATVRNNWGNDLNNIYAKLLINGTELLQTPNINLAAWQEGELKGILKVDLPLGNYSALLKLFFEGEKKDEPITLTIIEPAPQLVENKENRLNFQALTITIIIILIVLIIILLFFLLKKRSEEEKKG